MALTNKLVTNTALQLRRIEGGLITCMLGRPVDGAAANVANTAPSLVGRRARAAVRGLSRVRALPVTWTRARLRMQPKLWPTV